MLKPRETSGRARRQRANRLGRRIEWLAAALLMLRGYRILARRFLVAGGEIDIIVQRGSTVAFVEVKVRATLEEALASVSATKRRRIERAASVWLTRNPWAVNRTLRGDAVIAAPGRWPRHVLDAFPVVIF